MTEIRLTLGTPVYDDFDGLFFTLKSIQVHHPAIFERSEIVVVDNHPNGIQASTIERFLHEINYLNNIRLVKLESPVGTAPAKQKVIDSASNEWVVVFDCHILFEPGAFDYLLREIAVGNHDRDLLTGPLVHANGKAVSTHFEWKWRGQMLGVWATAQKDLSPGAPAFEIPGIGNGVFCVNKRYFPGFHPAFRGFGAEEMYIHEKVRRNGGAAYCVPGFRWHHRFHRPAGVPYPNLIWHRVRNYVIGFKELGLDITEIYDYFVRSGFFSQSDWDMLISDPIANEEPPLFFSISDTAPEKAQIIGSYQQQQPVPGGNSAMSVRPSLPPHYQELAKYGGKVSQLHEEQIRQRIANIPDHQLQHIPIPPHVQQEIDKLPEEERPKAARAYREGVIFSQWKKAMENLPSGTPGTPQKTCCQGKGEIQTPQFREAVIQKLKGIQQIDDLSQAVDSSEVDPFYRDIILQHLRGCKRILEIGDDPIGGTSFILQNMDPDAILVVHYQDPKFAPELNELGRLAVNAQRDIKMVIGPLDDLDIRDATFDLAFLNPTFVDFESVSQLLNKVLPNVKGRVLFHKTEKYWGWTADRKPGIMTGMAKILNDPQFRDWSVIRRYKEGLGLTILSNLPEDKPKLPGKIQIAATFAKAVAKHIATGSKEVSKKELEYRLQQCSICEYRVEDRCSLCGCFITSSVLSKGKAYWKDQKCPIGRWEIVEQD